jgi:hypothetical protein
MFYLSILLMWSLTKGREWWKSTEGVRDKLQRNLFTLESEDKEDIRDLYF